MKHQQEGQSWSKNKINWADNERTKLEKVKSSRPCSTVSFPWWDKIFPREFTVMSKDPSLTVNTISQSTTFPSVIKTYKLYRKSSSKFNRDNLKSWTWNHVGIFHLFLSFFFSQNQRAPPRAVESCELKFHRVKAICSSLISNQELQTPLASER